jgi:hypothetical protein
MPRALPPRYPPGGSCWPAQMRSDMVAGFLDYRDTAELASAVRRGEVPPPTSQRGSRRCREPVWARAELERFVAPKLDLKQDPPGENLAALV